MKKVAILQSNYVPWKGYFDLIASVDEFIIYDDVQYTKNDWRNRNQIKTPTGRQWLTIPVRQGLDQTIREVEIANPRWPDKHLKTLQANYSRAPYFEEVSEFLAPIYAQGSSGSLSAINVLFIKSICEFLQICTQISDVREFDVSGDRNERLVALCQATNADCYVSGPSAQGYLNTKLFAAQNLRVEWFDYSNYAAYTQLWGPFVHHVSVLDLLYNCGSSARMYLQH